jgi:D-beta-D-heptose 7-phosphate kinase / D-beta-D-heptose 1-phosphate adenosyltransferase
VEGLTRMQEQSPAILVVGDLMIDHYLWGGCERISPEAPVQVVDIAKETTVLGGAGNVINNLVTLGAQVSVAGVIGNDAIGAELLQMLQSIGATYDGVMVQEGRRSSKKSRVIAANQQILRYDNESKDAIAEPTAAKILETINSAMANYQVVILSDYGKGVLTQTLAQGIIASAKKHGVKVLVDPKGVDYSKYYGAHLLTPNKKEAILATGIDIKDDTSLEQALLWLKTHCELERSMITLSEDGIALHDGMLKRFPTVAREVFDVTGAGDTVIASLAYALSCGMSIDEAAKFANLAAGVVVGKIGSATASLDEIVSYESSLRQSSSEVHIKSIDEMGQIVKYCRAHERRIVFTNGCFDILHVGHVKYLQEAKSYGDILIVGLNSDASVRSLRGETRPINTQDDRAYLLAALEAVDYVVIFDEETPYELIKMIHPDVLVKGGDYRGKEVVGTEFAGELRLVDFVDGKSTTATIAKINKGTLC